MADGITRIAVEGFKSIVNRQEIEIAPLTILAGANSSGKSSIMQPLLMLKQTLEATYDPGPLKIDGPNVKFTSTGQFLSKTNQDGNGQRLSIEVAFLQSEFDITFCKGDKPGLEVLEETLKSKHEVTTLRPNMSPVDMPTRHGKFFSVSADRFFLDLVGENRRLSMMQWSRGLSQARFTSPGCEEILREPIRSRRLGPASRERSSTTSRVLSPIGKRAIEIKSTL